jgi:competence CoiA-like predicted nuclease
MNLNLSPAVNKNYQSSSQIVRVVTEEWGTKNLYCPACDSNTVTKAPPIPQPLTLHVQFVAKLISSKAVEIGVGIR